MNYNAGEIVLKAMKKSKKSKKAARKEESTKEAQEKQPDKPFDFGGLPQRDLKKNLGCG